jgi:hypothetical protein
MELSDMTGREVPINPAGSDGRRNTFAVYSQESRILSFFWGVDSRAARPGRAALEWKAASGQCKPRVDMSSP